MLRIHKRKKRSHILSKVITGLAVCLLAAGLYLLSLVAAPAIFPLIASRPINVTSLPSPSPHDNRIIIPKIGVDIPYAPGASSLNEGAEWRYPDRGNPNRGGNFIIAAHRFSIQPTPGGTVEKSPFYNINKLVAGDKVIVDYAGVRYAYEVNKVFNVSPTQVEIEAPSETPKLTLYSCELGGSDAGRIVLVANPIGRVALNTIQSTTN